MLDFCYSIQENNLSPKVPKGLNNTARGEPLGNDFIYPVLKGRNKYAVMTPLPSGDAGAARSAYRMIESAVRERAGAKHFQGVTVQPNNRGMQKLCKKLGFRLRHIAQEMLVNAEIEL